MIILGLETSCDETAVALVNDRKQILSSHVFSQLKDHAIYGGVVPEIAARAHSIILPQLVKAAFDDTGIGWHDIDGVAATCGPGLIGGLLVGATFGKAMAYAQGRPFIGVNHLEGHALTPRLTDNVEFPYLLLLMSGGHTQLLKVNGLGDYELLGSTLDDALGECFDKAAKMMGLPWPGGPEIERAAQKANMHAQNPARFTLPRPLKGRAGCDFSFSGLKTAVRLCIHNNNFTDNDVPDLCAAFQSAVADILKDRVQHAIDMCQFTQPQNSLIVAGGVAANQYLRRALQAVCGKNNFTLIAPPPKLCTDNAAMIAWAGLERLQAGLTDDLSVRCRPRWPLMELKAN